jgi:hypothetical protein
MDDRGIKSGPSVARATKIMLCSISVSRPLICDDELSASNDACGASFSLRNFPTVIEKHLS